MIQQLMQAVVCAALTLSVIMWALSFCRPEKVAPYEQRQTSPSSRSGFHQELDDWTTDSDVTEVDSSTHSTGDDVQSRRRPNSRRSSRIKSASKTIPPRFRNYKQWMTYFKGIEKEIGKPCQTFLDLGRDQAYIERVTDVVWKHLAGRKKSIDWKDEKLNKFVQMMAAKKLEFCFIPFAFIGDVRWENLLGLLKWLANRKRDSKIKESLKKFADNNTVVKGKITRHVVQVIIRGMHVKCYSHTNPTVSKVGDEAEEEKTHYNIECILSFYYGEHLIDNKPFDYEITFVKLPGLPAGKVNQVLEHIKPDIRVPGNLVPRRDTRRIIKELKRLGIWKH